MFEEEDVRQYYIPWVIFDELHDEKNCRYGDVAIWSRMRSRILDKLLERSQVLEPTLAGLYREIKWSRFGDVLAYLVKKEVLADTIPKPLFWLHTIPKTHYIRIHARDDLQESDQKPFYGAGASYGSFTEALSKAIGEFLERYVCLTTCFGKKNKVVQRAFGDKRIPRALLYETPRFYEWQREYIRNGLTSEILNDVTSKKVLVRCVRGESLTSGKKVNIPLQYIQWGPKDKRSTFTADTYILSPQTTSGAGGGFTLTDATLSGLCELVERDGFLIYWLNRLSPRQICINPGNSSRFLPRFLEVYRSLSDRGYKVYFLDTTTDVHIPSIACVILTPLSNGHKGVSVAGGCHPDPRRALERALLEHNAFLTSPIKENTISVHDSAYVPFADRRIGKQERITMWRSGEMHDDISFFLSGKEISSKEWADEFPPAPVNQKSALVYILSEFARMEKESGAAYEVFQYEARHKILEALEYHVVKVVIPALMPLYLRENLVPLDSVRLREVPKKLGYTAVSINAYNPIPHPFS